MARTELGQGEVAFPGSEIGITLERLATVGAAFTALLTLEVIRQVGSQTLTPVAARKIDKYSVAPPVVQNFMR